MNHKQIITVKKKILSILALFAAGFMFVACEGDVGPQGAKGDTGTVGAAGPKGAAGDKGDTGTPGTNGSSVVVVIDVTGGEIAAGIGAWGGWNLSSTQATFAEAPNSVIMLYLQTPSGDWYRVPGPVIAENGIHTMAMEMHNNAGAAQVRTVRVKGAGVLKFTAGRLIVIKSDPNARRAGVNYDDYEAVKKYYNLAD